jgi:ectoine hydroxylase-related dioxygenase (phytanoyl-CoA dioxygenase family)
VPQLIETSYVQNANYLASKLLHPDCVLWTNYVLLKPARIGIGTPWHQDEAYRDPRFLHHELTFWIPLQDEDVDQGCMMFIPESLRQRILTHESPNHDPRKHVIVCPGGFQVEQAVACPLSAGGWTIHDQRTLRCTRNNHSGVDR